MDKKRHGLQISGRMKLRHHHFERRDQTMSSSIVQFNEEIYESQIKKLVRDSMEETLNKLLEGEVQKLTKAVWYRAQWDLPWISQWPLCQQIHQRFLVLPFVCYGARDFFGITIIECYHSRESNVEEDIVKMYLGGISVHWVEETTEIFWGSKVSASSISELLAA